MAEQTEASADPSMEEILASIRKIIADDAPPQEEPAPAAESSDDVLELTQVVEETPPAPVVVPEPPTPSPPPPPPVMQAPEPPPPPSPPPQPIEAAEDLISEPVASTTASKLSSLANTVEIERLASSPMSASLIGNGHRTLEDMVIELMRPLLKDWLDQNLPGIVDRLVQKEIERIARRS